MSLFFAVGHCSLNASEVLPQDFIEEKTRLLASFQTTEKPKIIKKHSIIVTDNERKFEEYKSILNLYNLLVVQVEKSDIHPSKYCDDDSVRYVFSETSFLCDLHSNEKLNSEEYRHMKPVYNKCVLKVYFKSKHDKSIQEKIYEHKIKGSINFNCRKEDDIAFDWDDIFVVQNTGLTYHDTYKQFIKVSARDLVLADFFKEYLHFSKHKDFNYYPIKVGETVDISVSGYEFAKCIGLFESRILQHHNLDRFLNKVLADGFLLKSPQTRREGIYWFPGLNSPVPTTPKGDEIHEITFLYHDLMHQLIKDLVPTGITSDLYKQVYIIYRMSSEAITLVLADMFYIDCLSASHVDYDFTTRKIYPLFCALDINWDENFSQNLKKILQANVAYALLGDDSLYRALLKSEYPLAEEILTAYKDKFGRFFIEDYRWTAKNYEAFLLQSRRQKEWVDSVGRDYFKKLDIPLLDEFADELYKDYLNDETTIPDLVFAVFNKIFDNNIAPCITSPIEEIREEVSHSNAFKRYMLGQSFLFSKYNFAPGAKGYFDTILRELKTKEVLNKNDMQIIRDYYNFFVDFLANLKLITEDDRVVYKQIHPIFPPFFVSYDSDAPGHESVEEAAKIALGNELTALIDMSAPYRIITKKIRGANVTDLKALWDSLKGIEQERKIKNLLANAGVEFYDNGLTFIKKPFVSLVALGGVPIHLNEQQTEDQLALSLMPNSPFTFNELRSEFSAMMGYSSNLSYLNPKDVEASQMGRKTIQLGHHSVAHTTVLSMFIAGVSIACEAEFNTQRDLIHLSRITVARTKAENSPPVVVHDEKILSSYQVVLQAIKNQVEDARIKFGQSQDVLEAVNLMYPAAKGTAIMFTGSLNAFKKLTNQRSDKGKELEYRNILSQMNKTLNSVFPELFQLDIDLVL